MKVNYYTVFECNSEFPPKTAVSFTDKEKAQKHLELLNESGEVHILVPSEITFFLPQK